MRHIYEVEIERIEREFMQPPTTRIEHTQVRATDAGDAMSQVEGAVGAWRLRNADGTEVE